MQEIYKIFAIKPKLVTNFPEWMLSREILQDIRSQKQVAIAEIAGRDSFAAIIKVAEEGLIKKVVPTICYTGTEYGDFTISFKKLEEFKDRLQKLGVFMYPTILLGDPEFWHVLCGRFISKCFKDFKEFSPCVGCHLYLHSIRIPLAHILNAKLIIAGEREFHDKRIKVNQCKVALDIYSDFAMQFGVKLVLPVRCVKSGEEIKELIGVRWGEGKEQTMCVLSKNYRDGKGMAYYNTQAIRDYLVEYALPVAEEKIKEYLSEI